MSTEYPPMDEITPTNPVPQWNPAKLILFRFLFVYLILFLFPFPLDLIPPIQEGYAALWTVVVQLVGERLFQVEILLGEVDSGDTAYEYVKMFCCLMLATFSAIAWTLLDRRRSNYTRLYGWLRVYVRFSLAALMIAFGAFKVIPFQFRGPSLERLVEPLGEFSPMALLWTFMGASKPYSFFAGLGEMVGGLLLTIRRTTLLGSLLIVAVLSNVVMLNFSYDVCVKLMSCHMLAMAVFLAAHDLRRLGDLLLFNRPVQAVEIDPTFQKKWLQRTSLVLRTVVVIGFTLGMLLMVHGLRETYDNGAPKSPLYGIWNVEEFELDGEIRSPLLTDADRWRRVIFDSFTSMDVQVAIQPMESPIRRFDLKLDTESRTFNVTKQEDPEWKASLTYERPEPDLLVLAGTFEDRNVRAKLRRVDPSNFLLLNRGFHWINETPYLR